MMLVDSDQDSDGELLVCAVVEEIESLNREEVQNIRFNAAQMMENWFIDDTR